MKRKIKKFISEILLFIYKIIKIFLWRRTKIGFDHAYAILNEFSADPKSSPVCDNNIKSGEYDLTIIVPAYNSEKYIDECLQSVINQKTKYDYRVIVVNDGSTDKTREIIEKYKENEKIIIVDQENKGHSGARNSGLKMIKSNYIMFFDSDDILTENTIEKMLSVAYEDNADIVQGGYVYFVSDISNVIHITKYGNRKNIQPIGILSGFSCGKLYKSHLFENICYPEGYWYEDSILSALVHPSAKNVTTIDEICYYYRKHESSISSTGVGKPKSIDALYVIICVLKAQRELNIKTDKRLYELLLRQIVLIYKRTSVLDEKIKQCIFSVTQKMLSDVKDSTGHISLEKPFYKELESAVLNGYYYRYKFLCKIYKS